MIGVTAKDCHSNSKNGCSPKGTVYTTTLIQVCNCILGPGLLLCWGGFPGSDEIVLPLSLTKAWQNSLSKVKIC